MWEERDSGEWTEGTGIDRRAGGGGGVAVAAAAESEAGAGAEATEDAAVVGEEAVYAEAGHVIGARVEAAATVAAFGVVAGPEAEVGADVDAATGDVPDAEAEAVAAGVARGECCVRC